MAMGGKPTFVFYSPLSAIPAARVKPGLVVT
jgi:hypothetical protein